MRAELQFSVLKYRTPTFVTRWFVCLSSLHPVLLLWKRKKKLKTSPQTTTNDNKLVKQPNESMMWNNQVFSSAASEEKKSRRPCISENDDHNENETLGVPRSDERNKLLNFQLVSTHNLLIVKLCYWGPGISPRKFAHALFQSNMLF